MRVDGCVKCDWVDDACMNAWQVVTPVVSIFGFIYFVGAELVYKNQVCSRCMLC